MTFYGGQEIAPVFAASGGTQSRSQRKIPEEQYGFKATADTRSIGETLVRVALSPGFQLHVQQNRMGDLKRVDFPALRRTMHRAEVTPRTRAEIVALLKSAGEKLASFLEGLPDDFLAERIAMPAGAQPHSKSRFEMLLSPQEHEMHHRGQLITLQRMIGLKPHLTRQMEERFAQPALQAQQAPQAAR